MRPLLVLDCDEVILQFAHPFQQWLDEVCGIDLRYDSFSLMGNMSRKETGEAVAADELPKLLDRFFDEAQHRQYPADDVQEALADLRRDFDVQVLTNIPAASREKRVAVLQGLGLDIPVHANRGTKGPMLAKLTEGRRAVFVDDIPRHHESAAKHAPHVWRLHMVAHEELRGLIPPAPQAHARIDHWKEAAVWIRAKLEGSV